MNERKMLDLNSFSFFEVTWIVNEFTNNVEELRLSF